MIKKVKESLLKVCKIYPNFFGDILKEEMPLKELVSLPEIYHPATSPDGNKIAFYWDKSGRNELYILEISSNEVKKLSDGQVPRNARWPIVWGGEGERIYFHKDEAGNEQNDIYSIDLNGNVREEISAEGQCIIQDSSSDSSKILFTSTMEDQMNLYTYNRENEEIKKLTNYEEPITNAIYSPNNEFIAYTTNELENKENQDIYLSKSNGKDIKKIDIGEDGAEAKVNDWTKDGRYLLISDNSKDKDRCGIYDLKTDEPEWYGDKKYEERAIALSPEDNGFIALRGRKSAWMPIYIDLEGESKELDLPEGVSVFPNHASGMTFSSNKSLIFGHTTSNSKKEIYQYDLEEDEFQVLLSADYGEIDPDKFVEADYLTYESFDGLEIGALLYDSGERPSPGLVMVHGGPHGQATKSFDLYVQFLVNRGFTVLQPNYRGSIGRGREFKNKIHKDWGGGELEDIAKAGEWLKNREWIDEDQVAVFGGSYGGYSTYMQLVKKPELWTTGIAWIGITDLHKMYEESMPHFKSFLEEQMGDPEENKELWEERSAINHIDNIEKPIQIIQGKNDPRCPVSQARIFKDALEEIGWEEGEDFAYNELGEGHASTDINQKIKTFEILEDFLDREMR